VAIVSPEVFQYVRFYRLSIIHFMSLLTKGTQSLISAVFKRATLRDISKALGIPTPRTEVCFWHLADIDLDAVHVRFEV
jgi:hypothetical protein